MRVQVIASLQVEGVHCWPGCDIKGMEYLRYPHRHMFHVTVKKTVLHADREIEIITLKNSIAKHLESFNGDFKKMSCEMIAQLLIKEFDLDYCCVLEDGENGAEVSR